MDDDLGDTPCLVGDPESIIWEEITSPIKYRCLIGCLDTIASWSKGENMPGSILGLHCHVERPRGSVAMRQKTNEKRSEFFGFAEAATNLPTPVLQMETFTEIRMLFF